MAGYSTALHSRWPVVTFLGAQLFEPVESVLLAGGKMTDMGVRELIRFNAREVITALHS